MLKATSTITVVNYIFLITTILFLIIFRFLFSKAVLLFLYMFYGFLVFLGPCVILFGIIAIIFSCISKENNKYKYLIANLIAVILSIVIEIKMINFI